MKILFLFISFTLQLMIKEGVYNLLWDNRYLQFNKNSISISNTFIHPNSYFRIKKINTGNYYFLQTIKENYLLSYSLKKILVFINEAETNKNSTAWKFIISKNNNYAIKNKNNCYIKITKNKITCENLPLVEASVFNLIKIYEEGEENITNEIILEKEPIDVLIY